MKDLYTVVLTEHLNERSCFERDFAFYKGDLLFHFLNFNHVNDPRFCEVSGKRRQAIYLGMQWIEFPIILPLTLINGGIIQRNPVCFRKKNINKIITQIPKYVNIVSIKPISKTAKRKEKIFSKNDFRCVICGSTQKLTQDHIIPLSRGGTDKLTNLQCMCFRCNQVKGNLKISNDTLKEIIGKLLQPK